MRVANEAIHPSRGPTTPSSFCIEGSNLASFPCVALPRGKATSTVLDVRYCTKPLRRARQYYYITDARRLLPEAPLRSQAANRRRMTDTGSRNVRRGEAIG